MQSSRSVSPRRLYWRYSGLFNLQRLLNGIFISSQYPHCHNVSSGKTGSGRMSKTSFFRIMVWSCHSLSSMNSVDGVGESMNTASGVFRA